VADEQKAYTLHLSDEKKTLIDEEKGRIIQDADTTRASHPPKLVLESHLLELDHFSRNLVNLNHFILIPVCFEKLHSTK